MLPNVLRRLSPVALVALAACGTPRGGPPTERMGTPYTVVPPTGTASAAREAALADLDPIWVQRTRNATVYDGATTLWRVRVGAVTGPSTPASSMFVMLTCGDRSGSQGADRDRDGLSDEAETMIGSNPDAFDTDGDTIPDGFEVFGTGTRPELADSDGDGSPDNVELDLDDPEIYSDTDGDRLRNGQERASFGTSPTSIDSDGDAFGDDYEYYFWTAMNDPSDPDLDSDDDGQPDDFEVANGTDPASDGSTVPDADGDALPDFADEADQSVYATVPGHAGAVPAGGVECFGNSGTMG